MSQETQQVSPDVMSVEEFLEHQKNNKILYLGHGIYCHNPDELEEFFEQRDQALTAPLLERIRVLEDNLRWILPMAKGYAHEHPVGSNQEIIDGVIEALHTPAEGNIS